MRRLLPVLAVSLVLAACQASYQPLGVMGTGYTESWHGKDKVVVDYHGGVGTRAAVAEDLALLRAAEIAQGEGAPWFAVARQGELQDSVHLPGRIVQSSDYLFPYAAFGTEGNEQGNGAIVKQGARLYVVLLRTLPEGVKPGVTHGVYDTREVRADLGRLYAPDR